MKGLELYSLQRRCLYPFFHTNVDILSETLQSEILKLSQWCQASKLSINLKKSNFVVLRPRQKKQIIDISVKINNQLIKCVTETVILDENLLGMTQILTVFRRISKSIGIIYK